MIKGHLGKLEVGDALPVRIFGVLNLSTESFYKKSIVSTKQEIENQTRKMIEQGADGIDIGAQSTRPIQIYGGKGRLDEESELNEIKKSLFPVLDILSSYDSVELSVDTTSSMVAEYALKNDVRIINDISGFKKDKNMATKISEFDGHSVIMAAKKEPGDVYTISDIIYELRQSIEIGKKSNIKEDKIIIDPGIGSWEARPYYHDFNIIKNLRDFRILNKPIYLGISRKTSIGKVLGDAIPEERLFGTLGATIIALINGTHVVRTHDVKPTKEAIIVAETILNYDDEAY